MVWIAFPDTLQQPDSTGGVENFQKHDGVKVLGDHQLVNQRVGALRLPTRHVDRAGQLHVVEQQPPAGFFLFRCQNFWINDFRRLRPKRTRCTLNNRTRIGQMRKERNMPKQDTISFEKAWTRYNSVYNRPGFAELEPIEAARASWDKQTGTKPSLRRLTYRRLGRAWRQTCRYNDLRGITKLVEPVTFELTWELLAPIYNRPGVSELEPMETARTYWNEQKKRKPTDRHLRFRKIGDLEWIPTGCYSHCKKGISRNLTYAENVEIHQVAAQRSPAARAQKNHIEAKAIAALKFELDQISKHRGENGLRWKPVSDGLKADVLVQRINTATPGLWTALQIKSCTHRDEGRMIFMNTSGYLMPMLCLSLKQDKIVEHLLFPDTIDRKNVSVTHDTPSRDPKVQAAKTTAELIYDFLCRIPSEMQRERDFWVYGAGQASPMCARGMEVQRFCEILLEHEVDSPWEQHTAVDAIITHGTDRVGLSFKTATCAGQGHKFELGAAPQRDKVRAFIVGFRENNRVVSLGVMSIDQINWDLHSYFWSPDKQFGGILNITTGLELRNALDEILK